MRSQTWELYASNSVRLRSPYMLDCSSSAATRRRMAVLKHHPQHPPHRHTMPEGPGTSQWRRAPGPLSPRAMGRGPRADGRGTSYAKPRTEKRTQRHARQPGRLRTRRVCKTNTYQETRANTRGIAWPGPSPKPLAQQRAGKHTQTHTQNNNNPHKSDVLRQSTDR